MEFQVKHIVELGPQTAALLATLTGGTAKESKQPVESKPVPKAEKPVLEEKPKAPKAPAKPAAEDFDALDDDAKLEAIKTEVTKHTKKGKSADIKALLTHFDAGRASELAVEQYGEFYQAIKRYGAGETVEAITENELA